MEGEDPRMAKIFYRVVAQAVLLFGSETWVILEVMERKVEVNQTGL